MSRTPFSCLQEKVQENRVFSGLAFLPRGHGSVLVGARSIRFDQGPRPEFLLHLLQSFAHVQLLRVCRHRRAPVGSGSPSACHGCAVACIGQPPPPSAPWPGVGWLARFVARGCGGAASLGWQVAWVWLGLASRGCAAVYTFRALFAWGCHWLWSGALAVSSICKTAALERILAPLVHLYW